MQSANKRQLPKDECCEQAVAVVAAAVAGIESRRMQLTEIISFIFSVEGFIVWQREGLVKRGLCRKLQHLDMSKVTVWSVKVESSEGGGRTWNGSAHCHQQQQQQQHYSIGVQLRLDHKRGHNQSC